MKIILADSLTQGGVNRSIRTNYSYDRLGRVEHINVDYGFSAPSQPLAHYEYYPTGNVKRVTLGNSVALDYTYHISGAVKTAVAKNLADNSTLYSETLYYEDCGTAGCKPQYNGNISRMAHVMAVDGGSPRTSDYVYDFMNRLTDVDDNEQDEFDEYFKYDAQGRITVQRSGAWWEYGNVEFKLYPGSKAVSSFNSSNNWIDHFFIDGIGYIMSN